jgi:hypothetical protein
MRRRRRRKRRRERERTRGRRTQSRSQPPINGNDALNLLRGKQRAVSPNVKRC